MAIYRLPCQLQVCTTLDSYVEDHNPCDGLPKEHKLSLHQFMSEDLRVKYKLVYDIVAEQLGECYEARGRASQSLLWFGVKQGSDDQIKTNMESIKNLYSGSVAGPKPPQM
ncbi:MAG: hypothetical protein EZS28_030151 [Streblomastix strix]|uniref:Uncharacterized protein n=1 Tax=Streblomastix strix TaxID=222440 RepID=A0A5J4UVK7_9EUKA|nr:MAG: hypothetical protein EZS28_030151 [Streblomastix strix]